VRQVDADGVAVTHQRTDLRLGVAIEDRVRPDEHRNDALSRQLVNPFAERIIKERVFPGIAGQRTWVSIR
jgi:hypothetical protein